MNKNAKKDLSKDNSVKKVPQSKSPQEPDKKKSKPDVSSHPTTEINPGA